MTNCRRIKKNESLHAKSDFTEEIVDETVMDTRGEAKTNYFVRLRPTTRWGREDVTTGMGLHN